MLEKINEIVDKYPKRNAYVVGEESITYKVLWDNSFKYSILLKKQSNKPVIIHGNKDIYMIESILSCIMANRTYIPVGLCTPKDRLKKIIELSGASLIISEYDMEEFGIDKVSLNDLNKYDKFDIEKTINNNVYIIFTSGSTGVPKGVPISKHNLENFVNWISSLYPLDSYTNINVLNQANFSFDLSVADIYYSLCNGHTLYALRTEDSCGLSINYDVIKNVDLIVATPTFIKLCLLDNDFNYNEFPHLKCIYFCGEELETKVVKKIYDRFPYIEIINAYGPTEATSAVSAVNIQKYMLNDKLLPVGDMKHLATNVEIEDDEIVLSGESVFNGYLGDIVGGYSKVDGINTYKTGDLGYIEDNYLYCKGRIDNQIKHKGYRIELSEIEYHLNNINCVDEAVVIAKKTEDGIVKSLKAFCVVNDDISSADIKKKLNKNIPEYMIPNVIEIVDSIPLNENFKINRKDLD